MPSTGPDLTETTTASREPTDAEPQVAAYPVAEGKAAKPSNPDHVSPEPSAAEADTAVPKPAAPESARPDETVAAEGDAPLDAEAGADRNPADKNPPGENSPGENPEKGEHQDEGYDRTSLIPIAAGPPPEVARVVFRDLGLSEEVLRAIDDMGYRHPTPIQEQAIPYVLMGRDVMGTAQTGTGKTAGFTLPMLDILSGSRARARMPRSLILEPTRELALQVAENFVQYGKYLKLTHALIIGGESMSDQKDVLNRGVDVLIATPGRLLDMFERGTILLTDTKLLVIDEADRMLDMGFIPDVERIVSLLPATRQTLFFSATMGPEIRRLADAFLHKSRRRSRSRARRRWRRRSPRASRWSPSTTSARRCGG